MRSSIGGSRPARRLAGTLAVLAILGPAGAGAQELNLYTYREPGLIKPLIEAFTKETGVKVNTIFASSGLEERIRQEGANSPADVLLTVDIGRLSAAKEYGVTQPIKNEAVEKAVPALYRDPEGHWFGVSTRARVVYASKDRVTDKALTYESLADPKWKGKICIRSGQHLYNVSLFAAMVAHKGPEKTEEWLNGLKANLAKKPSGGDRDVAKDIKAGACDIGLGNTYYVGLMRESEKAEEKGWGDAINVILPTFEGDGTHVNISGVSILKNAPNKDSAVKFLTFMTSDAAQKLHAELNYEYPVKAGIEVRPLIASFGAVKVDSLPISEVAKHRKTASELVDKVAFDK